ncbi:MAG: methyltransferase domain-containing protein [Alphaproteobacteria bacterium]|nr:methyltransferase domain-containing protein [Alphaproteobacteria bacterium]
MTRADWLAFAATTRDARLRMADLVRAKADLDFGDIVACSGCGLHAVAAPPSATALDAFYQAYYANADYGAKREKKIDRARRRIRRLNRRAPGKRFLDVGCNLGFAVEAARLEGLAAHGVEVDAQAVSTAQRMFPNVTITCGDALSLAESGARFNFLWCTEVIEHAPDFRAFAVALARLAAPGALLFLTTPDAGHWRLPRQFATWDEVKPPEHLQWFTARHLRTLFEPEGFTVRFETALKPGLRMIATMGQSAGG